MAGNTPVYTQTGKFLTGRRLSYARADSISRLAYVNDDGEAEPQKPAGSIPLDVNTTEWKNGFKLLNQVTTSESSYTFVSETGGSGYNRHVSAIGRKLVLGTTDSRATFTPDTDSVKIKVKINSTSRFYIDVTPSGASGYCIIKLYKTSSTPEYETLKITVTNATTGTIENYEEINAVMYKVKNDCLLFLQWTDLIGQHIYEISGGTGTLDDPGIKGREFNVGNGGFVQVHLKTLVGWLDLGLFCDMFGGLDVQGMSTIQFPAKAGTILRFSYGQIKSITCPSGENGNFGSTGNYETVDYMKATVSCCIHEMEIGNSYVVTG